MKITTTAVTVLAATMFMTACAKKESAPPADTAPATTEAPAPAEATPAATPEVPNNEDGSQTSGDKVAPKSNAAAPPSG